MLLIRATVCLACSAFLICPSLCGAEPEGPADALAELHALRLKISEQQRVIDELRTQVGAQAQVLDRLIAAAPARSAPAEAVAAAPVAPADPVVQARAEKPAPEQPLYLQLGKVRLKPGGFLDLGFVARSKNLGSGVPTAFDSIPFGDTVRGQLSDVRFSAQNSRVSLGLETSFSGVDLKAYIESDFLGTAPANLAVTSNSGTLRMRQYWARVGTSKWAVLGGQAWSLLTPNRVGVGSEPSSVFTTVNEDPNYMVGLVWGRDPQVRVMFTPGKGLSAAFSLEAAEQHSAGVVTLPAALSSIYNTQINTGAGFQLAPTILPDIIAKVAWDGSVGGRLVHVETAGLARAFRTFNPLTTHHYLAPGYGASVNGSFEVVRNFRLLANSFLSSGGGRYVFGLGPDLIARADGSLRPVSSYAGLGGFEYTLRPRENPNGMATTLFGYFGASYFQRETAMDTDGSLIGFGYAGSPSSANRLLQQVSIGLNQTIWSNPMFGSVRIMSQLSHLTRSPWWVTTGRPRNAPVNMIFVGLRYELP